MIGAPLADDLWALSGDGKNYAQPQNSFSSVIYEWGIQKLKGYTKFGDLKKTFTLPKYKNRQPQGDALAFI